MSIGAEIKNLLGLPDTVVRSYLADLTDDHLMIRPHEKANHIAWQLGHLITSEYSLNNMVSPDSMPALPDGFYDAHGKEAAASDNKDDFCTKDEYIKVMEEQRAGTFALLDRLSDEELQAPSPEKIRIFGPTVASVIGGQAAHWMMHAGQWVIVRRQLGKDPLF